MFRPSIEQHAAEAELALVEIDRVIAAGVRFGCVFGGCRLWAQCAVPPGAYGSQIGLGGGHSYVPVMFLLDGEKGTETVCLPGERFTE